jgi:hypothetical protein
MHIHNLSISILSFNHLFLIHLFSRTSILAHRILGIYLEGYRQHAHSYIPYISIWPCLQPHLILFIGIPQQYGTVCGSASNSTIPQPQSGPHSHLYWTGLPVASHPHVLHISYHPFFILLNVFPILFLSLLPFSTHHHQVCNLC